MPQPLPTIGENSATADPKILSAFTELQPLLAQVAALQVTEPTVVTSLPGSPVDGQEVYYQADATNGVIWHLRYRSASASAYKWEFVGGGDLFAEAINTTVTLPASLATVAVPGGPAVTLARAGDYLVHYGVDVSSRNSGTSIQTNVFAGDTAGNTYGGNISRSIGLDLGPAPAGRGHSSVTKASAVPAATTATLRGQSADSVAGSWTLFSSFISVRPIRLG